MKIINFKEIIQNPVTSVLLIPLFYFLYQIFELGRLSYFNIPSSFFVSDLSECLNISFFMVVFFQVVMFLYYVLDKKYAKFDSFVNKKNKELIAFYKHELFFHGLLFVTTALIVSSLCAIAAETSFGFELNGIKLYYALIFFTIWSILSFYRYIIVLKIRVLEIREKSGIDKDSSLLRGFIFLLYIETFLLFIALLYFQGYLLAVSKKFVYKIDDRKDVYDVLIRSDSIISKDYIDGKFGEKTVIFDLKNKVITKIKIKDIK